ncbi:MAG: hypothetical protein KKF89_02115, partial [Nanoarchaeota archaeon]|nr:hypothetical protein [Nanoarchaeota archaeon]
FDGGFLIGGQEFDAVASTCPWAIPYGVQLANNKQLPFMYVRQSKKSHGLKQQIEGIPIAGQRVLLFDYHMGESYAENASDALREKGVEVVEIRSVDIYSILKSRKLTGLKVPMIEDLISTGGSSATAVQDVRNNGATCNHCISIFNYGLNKAAEEFATLNPKCNVTSVLTYDTLLKEAEETEYINPEDSEVLAEWRADPFNWGERHGFPKVEK